jgi:aldose 1-epimerase
LNDPYEDKPQIGRVRGFMRSLTRSGMFTGLLLVLLNLALLIAYIEHGRGNLHKLKQRIGNERPEAPIYRPGGQDPILLTRSRIMGDSAPEFTSVTLLPGRGMNVFQITAFVPGKGEINLLASPSIEEATKVMTGSGADAGGAASLTMGAAFEAPWADGIRAGSSWRGQAIGTDVSPAARTAGLLITEPAMLSDVTALPDGGAAEASFEVGKNEAEWPWKTQLKITVLLSSKLIDLTMTARNLGDSPEPIGLGWRPRFAVDRESGSMRLRLPAEMRLVADNGVPTGAVIPVAGTPYDYMPRQGVPLSSALDDCFTGFRQDLLDSGPVADLSFPTQDYGVRLTALTPTIRAIHVITAVRDGYAVMAPQFNYPDAFGRQWSKAQDPGLVVLQPGQSAQWKVRLEIFTPTSDVPGR